MKTKLMIIAFCVAAAFPAFAQNKQDERIAKSANVLQELLAGDNGLSKHILDQADCVVIFPSVKKVAIGIGSSYGRGVLVCRGGDMMKGAWGAPAMYKLDQGSIGLQLGSTALGSNAAAAAGPSGAQATSYNADAMKVDILTYSRSKGLFAGVSLEGASMDTDDDANKVVYGKSIAARDIITGGQAPTPAAQPLDDVLNKTSPTRM
jgi:SH3 domain-containing YSC84-like protein 1